MDRSIHQTDDGSLCCLIPFWGSLGSFCVSCIHSYFKWKTSISLSGCPFFLFGLNSTAVTQHWGPWNKNWSLASSPGNTFNLHYLLSTCSRLLSFCLLPFFLSALTCSAKSPGKTQWLLGTLRPSSSFKHTCTATLTDAHIIHPKRVFFVRQAGDGWIM